MPTDIPSLPASVLRLRDFAGWKLVIACACDRSAIWPVELLVRRHGLVAEPAVIVRRMRCVWCGLQPAFAEMDLKREAPGYAGGRPSARRSILPAP
jgi:hypothetical protein